jgi:hypothetical protein
MQTGVRERRQKMLSDAMCAFCRSFLYSLSGKMNAKERV